MLGPIFDAFYPPLKHWFNMPPPLLAGMGGGTFCSKMPFLPSNVLEMHSVLISKVFKKNQISLYVIYLEIVSLGLGNLFYFVVKKHENKIIINIFTYIVIWDSDVDVLSCSPSLTSTSPGANKKNSAKLNLLGIYILNFFL